MAELSLPVVAEAPSARRTAWVPAGNGQDDIRQRLSAIVELLAANVKASTELHDIVQSDQEADHQDVRLSLILAAVLVGFTFVLIVQTAVLLGIALSPGKSP